MFLKFSLAAMLTLVASLAVAGIPTEEEKTCPVGGEVFTIVGTASCTTMGRTMSFSPMTSCDFITRLPVCPGNGLPLFQEFTEDQIDDLTQFIETVGFQEMKKLPPWQRAYGLVRHLGLSSNEIGFEVMLGAFWFETGPFFESETAMDDFSAEVKIQIGRAEEDNKPYLKAILGYALAASGRLDEAQSFLNEVQQTATIPEYLQAYVRKVEICLADMSQADCLPDSPFRP